MAYLDDVRAERAQWASEEQAETTPATATVRTQAGWLIAIGVPCLIPPATPFGVFLVTVGGLLLLCSPAIAKAETAAHQNTVAEVKQGNGNGCGGVLWACLVATVIVAGVVIVALGAAQGVRP